MQERRNSSALAMELRLSCINPLIYPMRKCCMMSYVCLSDGLCFLGKCFIEQAESSSNQSWVYKFWTLSLMVTAWVSLTKSLQQGPVYKHTCILILSWISNYINYKVWNEITYLFPNFSSITIEVCVWRSNVIPHLTGHVITSRNEITVHIKNMHTFQVTINRE